MHIPHSVNRYTTASSPTGVTTKRARSSKKPLVNAGLYLDQPYALVMQIDAVAWNQCGATK